MFSDVPADGYSVELGQLEPIETRGKFLFFILLSFFLSFFLSFPLLNDNISELFNQFQFHFSIFPSSQGNILATGQMVRFAFSIIASFIQAFFLNGPSTNPSDCAISPENCWAWGFNVNEYYGFMFCCILVLVIPIYWLKELPPKGSYLFIY